MAREQVGISRTYQPGTVSVTAVSIPAGEDYVAFYFDATDMIDPAQSMEIVLEFSLDNGANWEQRRFKFFGAPHGPRFDPAKVFSKIGCQVPEPTSGRRQLRAMITLAGAALRTSFDRETKVRTTVR